MKQITIYTHGGPESLVVEDVHSPTPGPGEILVRNHAIGLNFTDIYFRTGTYTPPRLPFIPGNEGAGEVVSVGEGVTGFSVGDRVAYVMILGAYSEQAVVPARYAVHIPPSMAYETAAAIILKGLTAQYLLRSTFKVDASHTVLIHAAAGGVGQLLVQWAKQLGATVIGTVGSPQKAIVAKELGCDHVIEYRTADVADAVRHITRGKGCDVVYDSVGKATLKGSLASLRQLGYYVNFGSASGAVDTFDLGVLAGHGSLFATSPVLFDYLQTPREVLERSTELFHLLERGALKMPEPNIFPLEKANIAQQMLEERQTVGSTILVP